MIVPVAGGLMVALASVALYLASPNQQWGALFCTPAVLGWSGLAVLLGGMALLLSWAGIATAFFIAITLLMTAWSVVPVAVAWARRDRKERI